MSTMSGYTTSVVSFPFHPLTICRHPQPTKMIRFHGMGVESPMRPRQPVETAAGDSEEKKTRAKNKGFGLLQRTKTGAPRGSSSKRSDDRRAPPKKAGRELIKQMLPAPQLPPRVPSPNGRTTTFFCYNFESKLHTARSTTRKKLLARVFGFVCRGINKLDMLNITAVQKKTVNIVPTPRTKHLIATFRAGQAEERKRPDMIP